MRRWLAACVLLLLLRVVPCFGQGVVPDPPGLMAAAPTAESFRGALVPRVDLSPQIPPPRSRRPSMTCVSWAVCGVSETSEVG